MLSYVINVPADELGEFIQNLPNVRRKGTAGKFCILNSCGNYARKY